jgi:hypothetical protein
MRITFDHSPQTLPALLEIIFDKTELKGSPARLARHALIIAIEATRLHLEMDNSRAEKILDNMADLALEVGWTGGNRISEKNSDRLLRITDTRYGIGPDKLDIDSKPCPVAEAAE